MPFVGRKNAEIVTPEDVDDGVEVTCIGCQDKLKPRGSHTRDGVFVARHFWHPFQTDCDGGSGGESLEHQKMKSIAVSKAKNRWPEASVDTEIDVGDRRADVLVQFEEENPRLGEGVAIEVQYKHENKDIIRVTDEYCEEGYSSLWLWQDHFDGKDVDFEAGQWEIYWTQQVPDSESWGGVEQYTDEISKDMVEIEINLPVSWREMLPEQELRRAWYNGFKESFSDRQDIEYRDPKYDNTDSEWVDVIKRQLTGSRTAKWIKLVESPTGKLCFQLGKSSRNGGSERVTVSLSSSDFDKFVDVISALGHITEQDVSAEE